MRLSVTPLFLLTFCHVLSMQFWTDVKLEVVEWSKSCNLYSACIQPTLQLRLINLFNNETVSKILKVNFDKQQVSFRFSFYCNHFFVSNLLTYSRFVEFQASKTHLISFWDEGMPDMIVSTITINGIDPDYDFPRLCDSAGTIFLFRYVGTVKRYQFCSHINMKNPLTPYIHTIYDLIIMTSCIPTSPFMKLISA